MGFAPPLEWVGLLPPLSGGPPLLGWGPRCRFSAAVHSLEIVNWVLTLAFERDIFKVRSPFRSLLGAAATPAVSVDGKKPAWS